MNTSIEELLKKTSALRKDREAIANILDGNPALYPELLQCTLHPDQKVAVKACWILEIVILDKPELLYTRREDLFKAFHKAKDGSAIRPLAKIIAFWSEQTISKANKNLPALMEADTRVLIDYCFSWLLNDLPVAVKVFCMEALFHLGKKEPWVHQELMAVLEKEYDSSQPAFRARSRMILKRMAQNE